MKVLHLFQYISYVSTKKVKVKVKSLSRVRLFATAWIAAYQAPPSTEFSRQVYWSGLPFPSPGDIPDPGIEPRSPTLQADALPSEPPGKPKKNDQTNFFPFRRTRVPDSTTGRRISYSASSLLYLRRVLSTRLQTSP